MSLTWDEPMQRYGAREWADDHGYQSGRCPCCGARIWTDGVMACRVCGWEQEQPPVATRAGAAHA